MLAWVHQAIAAEHEFLDGLLGTGDARRMVGAVRVFGEGKMSEEEEWAVEMLDAAVSGLCTPLKVYVMSTSSVFSKLTLPRLESCRLSGRKRIV